MKLENLGKTEFTQPAILLVSSIALAVFKEKCNIEPEFVLGHSLAEFSALVAAGAIDYAVSSVFSYSYICSCRNALSAT